MRVRTHPPRAPYPYAEMLRLLRSAFHRAHHHRIRKASLDILAFAAIRAPRL